MELKGCGEKSQVEQTALEEHEVVNLVAALKARLKTTFVKYFDWGAMESRHGGTKS